MWRLMHENDLKDLLWYVDKTVPADLSLVRFCPIAADPYCCYVALKRTDSASTLRSMALVDDYIGDLKSPIKIFRIFFQNELVRNLFASEFYSLEAYLLSPPTSRKPPHFRRAWSPELHASGVNHFCGPFVPAIESFATVRINDCCGASTGWRYGACRGASACCGAAACCRRFR